MKSIKLFKYKDTCEFMGFVGAYDYKLDDVKGFSYGWKEQYHGNILKVYFIHFKDGEYELFRIVYFKSFNACNSARLGLINNKLLMWYDDANIRKYKVKDVWGMKDFYVIEN